MKWLCKLGFFTNGMRGHNLINLLMDIDKKELVQDVT
jgi:hypothetical protein